MADDRIDRLCAAGGLSGLDRSFAELMTRLSGSEGGGLPLAAALASRASAEGNVCLELDRVAGKTIPAGETAVRCPDLDRWVAALRESPVVGQPGEWRPLVLQGTRLYLYRHWDEERSLARFLRERSAIPAAGVDVALLRAGIGRLFERHDEDPDWQKIAGALAVLMRLCVITGGPGTGKTTTVARILALLMEQARETPLRIALAAPTGKAAARLQESIRKSSATLRCSEAIREKLAGMEAATLHRLLGRRLRAAPVIEDEEEPLPFDAVVVDEASMVSLHLLCSLAKALPGSARLILLGDRDQLASVEAGAILGDICGPDRRRSYSGSLGKALAAASGQAVPLLPEGRERPFIGDCIVNLTRSYRFGAESGIGELSRAINEGSADETVSILRRGCYGDLGWEAVPKLRNLQRSLTAFVRSGYGDTAGADASTAFERFNRFRILCALKDGPYGVDALNARVEEILVRDGILRPGRTWYAGRPVMVTRNDYGLRLFNGDIGIALADVEGGGSLRVFFPGADGTVRAVDPYRLPDHETAYAMTIHKSQGTEFDRVLVVFPAGDTRVLTREILYTGVTRARTRVDLRASESVLRSALSRRIERVSGLRDALWT